MAEGSIAERVRSIIVDDLGVDDVEVRDDARVVEHLGADSLDVVELVMRFEEEFGIEIPDEDAERIGTVRDVIVYLDTHATVHA
jgi:acyl carrier protein